MFLIIFSPRTENKESDPEINQRFIDLFVDLRRGKTETRNRFVRWPTYVRVNKTRKRLINTTGLVLFCDRENVLSCFLLLAQQYLRAAEKTMNISNRYERKRKRLKRFFSKTKERVERLIGIIEKRKDSLKI